MKILIAEVFELQSKTLLPQIYCVGQDGAVDRAVTDTLLDLIWLSHPNEDDLEKLVLLAEVGGYISPDLSLPDWGVNDTNIWLVAPMARPGCVCISNENSGDFSVDEGTPQQFTYEQFKVALSHWRAFMARIASEGKQALVGQRYEVVFP